MKRNIAGLLALLLAFTCFAGCQAREKITLDLSALQTEEGNFKWPGIEYGWSITEMESKTGYTVPDIPYSSSRGERLNKDYDSKTDTFDYRKQNDYEYAMFPLMKENKSVLVEYGDALGNLFFEFRGGELQMVYVTFGAQQSKIDPAVDYGGKKNDPQAVFDQLKKDLTEKYGTPTKEMAGEKSTVCEWKVFLNPEETEWTVLNIGLSGDETKLRIGY